MSCRLGANLRASVARRKWPWLFFLVFAALLMSCGAGTINEEESISTSTSALSTATSRITVFFPQGVGPSAVPLSAAGELKILARARVQTATLEPAPAANAAGAVTLVDIDANTGTITSEAPVTLGDRASVTGDVVSAGAVTRAANSVVTGSIKQLEPVSFDRWSWSVTLPASGSDVTVNSGAQSIAPGAFAKVTVDSGRLDLVAGTYYLDKLIVKAGGRLGLDTRNGPVMLYVREELSFRGLPTRFTGPNDRLLVVYLGTAPPALDKSFDGTLVAPSASVRLGVGGSPWNGAVYAKSVQLDPDVKLTRRMFTGWNQIAFDVEPLFECVERRGSSFVAHFGYHNPSTATVTVPVGTDNRFSSGLENRQQPTVFLPRTHIRQFAVTWVDHPSNWILNGSEAAIDMQKVCPAWTSFASIADTKVLGWTPMENFGTQTELRASFAERTLVQFDRGAIARALGPNGLIASARLDLTTNAPLTGKVRATAMQKQWTERGATWRCAIDGNTSPTAETCPVMHGWNLERRDNTWANPWERYAEARTPNLGEVSGTTISFDVTQDLQRFLGPERIGMGPSWILESMNGTPARFAAREAGQALAPRLVIQMTSFTDFDVVRDGASDATAPFSVVVDPTVVPSVSQLPPLPEGGAPRPVDALRSADGTQAQFAALEMLVYTNSPAELAAIQARRGATVISETPFAVAGRPRPTLLRIDPALADPAIIAPSVVANVPGMRGKQRVSSDTALRLLAALADEGNRGTQVGLNWLGESANIGINSLASQQLVDGGLDFEPDEETGSELTPNAFSWPHFGPTMHNITGAWMQAFPYSATTEHPVKVTIHDSGFAGDLLDGWEDRSPLCPNANCEKLNGCENGFDCPWHGSEVANVGFGEPNNAKGAAGPGYGAADLSLVYTLGTHWELEQYLLNDLVDAHDIMNMSYGVPLPDWFIALGGPGSSASLEGGTMLAREAGMLLFASAGNAGQDVDQWRCYEVAEPTEDPLTGTIGQKPGFSYEVCPWEADWYWPCENRGVNCVEGSNFTNRDRVAQSNHGADSVMHRASYTNLAAGGQNAETSPQFPNSMRVTFGTSSSAPLVAGIAALSWASARSKSADDIEECLLRNGKFVEALDSVRCAMGLPTGGSTDVAPRVTIVTPDENAIVSPLGSAGLKAEAGDESGPLTVEWFVNDVAVGTQAPGAALSFPLNGATGKFTAEARATDTGGKTGRAEVTFFAPPAPADIEIVLPATENELAHVGLPVELLSKVVGRTTNPCNEVIWSGSLNGSPIFGGFPGCSRQPIFNQVGTVLLTAAFTDSQGTASRTRVLQVIDDGLPHVKITSPQIDSEVWWSNLPPDSGSFTRGREHVATRINGQPFTLEAVATPSGTPYTYTWLVNFPGGVQTILPGNTSATTLTTNLQLTHCEVGRVEVRVLIVDAEGRTAAPDSVPIMIIPPGCPVP